MTQALAFLAADCSTEARSPMRRSALEAGARLRARDGWSVAEDYGDPTIERTRLAATVGFVDRSHLCKLELHGDAVAPSGAALAPGTAHRAEDGAWWCPLTPRRALVLSEPDGAQRLRSATRDSAVVEVTCGWSALTLAGPLAAELLARFCALDVRPAVTPVGAFRPGSIARTPGYLLREREDELLILTGWALGEYVWSVVADAAEQLGGGPAGLSALEGRREAAGA